MTLLKHKFDMKALFSFEILAWILDCRSESPRPAVHAKGSCNSENIYLSQTTALVPPQQPF